MSEQAAFVDEQGYYFTPVWVEVWELGLSPYEFTAFCWMMRRAGERNEVFESVPNMAKACGMNPRKFLECIRVLIAKGCIRVKRRQRGGTTVYAIRDKRHWGVPDGEGAHEPEPVQQAQRGSETTARNEVPRGSETTSPPWHLTQGGSVATVGWKPRSHEVKNLKDYTRDEDIEIHTANGETSSEPAIARGDKRRGARFDPQPFIDAWNEHSGELPKVIKLTGKRLKALERLVAEHETPQHALELWTDAVKAVARDEFWNERRYGFNNLLAGDKVIQRAEEWRSRSVTKAGQRPGRNGYKGDSPAVKAAESASRLLAHIRSTRGNG